MAGSCAASQPIRRWYSLRTEAGRVAARPWPQTGAGSLIVIGQRRRYDRYRSD